MSETSTIGERALTAKGRETRRRIVEAAADLMVERGVAAVSLDEVGRVTSTSKSQMYHYFASKDELVAAVVLCVRDRILAFQGDLLVAVESMDDLERWADSVVAFQRQSPLWSGCPLGTLSSELTGETGMGRPDIQEAFDSWQLLLQDALTRMRDSGRLRADADPERLAMATLASLQGGLLMSKALQDEAPLSLPSTRRSSTCVLSPAPDGSDDAVVRPRTRRGRCARGSRPVPEVLDRLARATLRGADDVVLTERTGCVDSGLPHLGSPVGAVHGPPAMKQGIPGSRASYR